jgi:hypothetical protein
MKELDQLSEKIELSALQSLHQCCPTNVRQMLGLELVEIADGVAACSRADQSILLNRVLGLGSKESVASESIEQVSEAYRSRDIENYFLHIYPESLSAEAKKLLSGSDYIKKRGWMKFQTGRPVPRETFTDLRVEQISPYENQEQSRDFGRIICDAFGMSDMSIPLLAGLANDDRWKLFVTYDGDQAAGAGGLFVDGNLGWVEWGATVPAFRRRGSQAAIMAARLSLASELGCEYVFTETGEEVEGDPQHSYKNILKAGFIESVLRENYAPS